MALIIPDAGELQLLDKMLKDGLSVDEDYILKLYKTNVDIDGDTVAADFTEADFTNYVSKTLTRAGWGAAATVGNKAEAQYSAAQSWTVGATGNVVYGYWVEGATSGICLWAEKFDTAKNLVSGDVLNVTPVFTLSTAD